MASDDWKKGELDRLLAIQPDDYLQVDASTISDFAMMLMVVLAGVCAAVASPVIGWLSMVAALVYHAHSPARSSAVLLTLPFVALGFCYYRLNAPPSRGHFD